MSHNTTYYWLREDWVWKLRQWRFAKGLLGGYEHPHDVCAIARNEADRRSMCHVLQVENVLDFDNLEELKEHERGKE